MNLSQFKILTFDVYGTLIDWESGMINGLKPLTDRVDRALGRDEILNAHALYESTAQRFSPSKKYSELLATVYRRLSEHWGISVEWEECLAECAAAKSALADEVSALKASGRAAARLQADLVAAHSELEAERQGRAAQTGAFRAQLDDIDLGRMGRAFRRTLGELRGEGLMEMFY